MTYQAMLVRGSGPNQAENVSLRPIQPNHAPSSVQESGGIPSCRAPRSAGGAAEMVAARVAVRRRRARGKNILMVIVWWFGRWMVVVMVELRDTSKLGTGPSYIPLHLPQLIAK
jgi:hypothetical protein